MTDAAPISGTEGARAGAVPPTAPAARASRSDRVLAAVAAALALGLLVVAARLVPDAAGSGTHTQLGLPRCGFMMATGYPCPTCGMTTAFAHAAHAKPLRAFVTQPFGAVLALGTAMLFWGGLHVAVFGSQLHRIAGRHLTPKVLWVLSAAAVAAWAYKIATIHSG